MSNTAWPWLAVAGLGALHGLNPATGWPWAAAWGLRSRNHSQVLRALLPIALGHAASVALVVAVVAVSAAFNRMLDLDALPALATAALALAIAFHLWRHVRRRPGPTARAVPGAHTGLALWSFGVSTAQGAGLMLLPALVPICMGSGAVREITASGSLSLALLALGVHTAAMLAVTGAVAAAVCLGVEATRGRSGATPNSPPAAAGTAPDRARA
ncbi:hypothetical protein [Hydrogenophaga sp.]|uniref:hypothetical protein n=1 Tax=Hydrogenophaga sp. TaxID=1904254 RepID=UPI003D0BB106